MHENTTPEIERKGATHHSRELGISAVGTGLAVAAEAGYLGQVKAKLILEPVDGVTGAAGEDLDKVVASEVACL